MTRRRVAFEYAHKVLGYLLMPLIPAAVLSGLWAVDAPRWMWGATAASFLAFAYVFMRLQRQGRCIDTYQAIWGVESTLPGNRRGKAIGWGIRRYSEENVSRTSWPKR